MRSSQIIPDESKSSEKWLNKMSKRHTQICEDMEAETGVCTYKLRNSKGEAGQNRETKKGSSTKPLEAMWPC